MEMKKKMKEFKLMVYILNFFHFATKKGKKKMLLKGKKE